MARDGEVFVVERNGQPKACLVPVSFLLPDIPPDRIAKELSKLDAKNENYKLTINDNKELEISCLETAAGESVVISIVLPHGYPNSAPRIYAGAGRVQRAEALAGRLAVDLRRDGGVERQDSRCLARVEPRAGLAQALRQMAQDRRMAGKDGCSDERSHIRENRVAVRHRARSPTSKSSWRGAARAARASRSSLSCPASAISR